MKKFFALTAVLVLLTSTSAFAVISGSGHDFTGTFTTEICNPCHTPHNALSTSIPLWAHTSSTSSQFTQYASPTMDAAKVNVTDLVGISLACLSCHDGTTNMDDFIGGANGTAMGANPTSAGVSANLGTNLADDHPIAIVLTDGLPEIDTLANIIGAGLPLYGAGSDELECATCHDVHNGGSGPASLLRITNAASAMCLACHEK